MEPGSDAGEYSVLREDIEVAVGGTGRAPDEHRLGDECEVPEEPGEGVGEVHQMLKRPCANMCSSELLQWQRAWTKGHMEVHQVGSAELSRHEEECKRE